MAYRNDMDALLERAESLERDLARAQEELTQLRGGDWRGGEPPIRIGVRYDDSAPPQSPEPRGDKRRLRVDSAHVLEVLEASHPVHLQTLPLGDPVAFEEAVCRAIELTAASLLPRHRGVPGDGTHAQLVGVLELLVALWREYVSGKLMPKRSRSWGPVELITRGWAPDNELRRLLVQIGQYYLDIR